MNDYMDEEASRNEVDWQDLQPAIRPACERIVKSDTFHNLVDILRKDPNTRELEATVEVKDVAHHPSIYTCIVRREPTRYFVHIMSREHQLSSIGGIYR